MFLFSFSLLESTSNFSNIFILRRWNEADSGRKAESETKGGQRQSKMQLEDWRRTQDE